MKINQNKYANEKYEFTRRPKFRELPRCYHKLARDMKRLLAE